ncbi:MAG: AAA family ATPase, partial [Selenomonas sp.]|nr:AAA family ATPase [Selenomonas sp.]
MEEKRRRLPIGVQSFAKLREGGFLYVDKTRYIYKLVQESSQYFLSRPRRFGKSLFLSTLKAYWEGNKELFEGLEIEKLEKDNKKAFEPYPVFYFDFNGQNYQRETALEDVLAEHLAKWEKIYGGDDKLSLSGRFRSLIRAATEKTGKGCVVLVDEYDKALLETLENATLEEHNKAVFKGFFGTLKSYDEYLRFVFITGVTKFSKVSIFSDLNQLRDISLESDYAEICGITQQELEKVFVPEIAAMAKSQKIGQAECLTALKKFYDGYHFSTQGEGVYNPFSLLNAFASREFRSYWFATGTPTFLVRRVREIRLDASRFTDRTLYADLDDLTDYRYENPNPIPLLYQTGYL